jgi:hypothetical protein
MNKYNRFPLAETARDYLTKCLKSGNTLAGHLLREVNLVNGELFTFLPAGADQSRFDQFRQGGIAKSTESISYLTGRVRLFLNSCAQGVVIFEDALAKKGDPCVEKSKTQMLFHGQEIYHYLLADNIHPQVVSWTVTQASAPHLFICAMTQLSQGQTFAGGRSEVSNSTLQNLAKVSTELVVGAYDAEGYVYWKKSG